MHESRRGIGGGARRREGGYHGAMIGYLDLPCGISGDIMLGCLVDAGWPLAELCELPRRLRLPEGSCRIELKDVMRGAIRAALVEVNAAEAPAHRHLSDIHAMLDAADLPGPVREGAKAVFVRLAQAEAEVHATTPDKIHFHEVGAVDAIIDIAGSVLGLHALGITRLHASALPMGHGWTHSQHGKIPLPAPATLIILGHAHAPVRPAPGDGEWVTPTGAALVAELAEFSQPAMQLQRIGTGTGQKDPTFPNVARLWIGQPLHSANLVELRTNIDDMNPQLYDDVFQTLLSAGARDVWLTPIQMKKNRPAVMVSVLADSALELTLSEILLRHTTTLGVRVSPVLHRREARREIRALATPLGEVKVKLKWLNQELVGVTPEYDDVKRLAAERGLPVREVMDAAIAAAHELRVGAAPRPAGQ